MVYSTLAVEFLYERGEGRGVAVGQEQLEVLQYPVPCTVIDDRSAFYDYIEADNPSAALALDELFSEKANRLIDHPGLGRPGRANDTREFVAHQNYVLISAESRP